MKKKIVTFGLLLFMAVSFNSCIVREHGHHHHDHHHHDDHHDMR